MLGWLRRRVTNLQTKLRIAEDALIRGDFKQASSDYNYITKTWPHVAFAHSRRGRALMQLGRHTEAAHEFERALQVDPGEPEAFYNKGLLAQKLGQEIEAFHCFENAFTPTRPHLEAGLKLAEATVARGSPSKALEVYQRVLDINPATAEAHFGYGEASMLLGREIDAMNAFRRALSLKPDFPAATGVTIFQQLFRPLSTRRPRATRPLICIPIISTYYRDWLGGQSYLVNFARIISTLPLAQRPRIVAIVFYDKEEDIDRLRPVFESLSGTDAVIGVANSQGALIYSAPVLDRINRRKNRNPGPTRNAFHELMSIVDWSFPILYPLWRVPAIPGSLFWIPDLQHRFWPSFFTTEEVVSRDRDMNALALRAVPIVFSSRTAQQHFDEHFSTQQCRTHVWHFVSQPDIASLQARERYQAFKLPERFYYTPNQFWRHKDHVTLFHALRRILDSGHNVTFVCTGTDLRTATDGYSRELLQLVEGLSLGQNLRLLGVLPREDQIEVMRHCCAVIQPSLFEGWSTVVEDARAIGRPIIASDIPVHREQLGESAAFFAPGSVESLATAVISLDHEIKPGPDPEREAAALIDLQSRMQKSAQDFLAILKQEAAFRG